MTDHTRTWSQSSQEAARLKLQSIHQRSIHATTRAQRIAQQQAEDELVQKYEAIKAKCEQDVQILQVLFRHRIRNNVPFHDS